MSAEFSCAPAAATSATSPPDRTSLAVRRRRAAWRRAAVRGGRITTVMLDLGGVVIASLFESVQGEGFPRGPLEPGSDYAEVESGVLRESTYWEHVARAQGCDVAMLWRQCSTLRPAMLEVISVLAEWMPVVALTNDMSHWFGPDWLQRFPPLGVFDHIFEASALGAAKPDPRAYHAALDAIGEPAHRCLLVDDLQVNVDGAASVGMATLLFDIREPEASARAVLDRLALPWRAPEAVFIARRH